MPKTLDLTTKEGIMKTLITAVLTLTLLLMAALPVSALEIPLEGVYITETNLNNEYEQGGCTATVPEFEGTTHCTPGIVTFDCDSDKGVWAERNYKLFAHAHAAQILHIKVNMVVNQARRIDKVCAVRNVKIIERHDPANR